jgi:hypothetical protein
MTDAPATPGLRASLGSAAESAKLAAAEYVGRARSRKRFERQVLFAIAALEQDSLEPLDLRFIADAAADAAAVCRTERPDATVASLVDVLERAARACDPESVAPEPWQRFLFDELDVDVRRSGRRWRLRQRSLQTEAATLDTALTQIFPTLSASRVGPIAFQILDWFES